MKSLIKMVMLNLKILSGQFKKQVFPLYIILKLSLNYSLIWTLWIFIVWLLPFMHIDFTHKISA